MNKMQFLLMLAILAMAISNFNSIVQAMLDTDQPVMAESSSMQYSSSYGDLQSLKLDVINKIEKVSEVLQRAQALMSVPQEEEVEANTLSSATNNEQQRSFNMPANNPQINNDGGYNQINDDGFPATGENIQFEDGDLDDTNSLQSSNRDFYNVNNGTNGLESSSSSSCGAWRISEIMMMVNSIETDLLRSLSLSEASNQADLAKVAIADCQGSLLQDQFSTSASEMRTPNDQIPVQETASDLLEKAMRLLDEASTELTKLENGGKDKTTQNGDVAGTSYGGNVASDSGYDWGSMTDYSNDLGYSAGSISGPGYGSASSISTNSASTQSRGRGSGCRRDGTMCQFSACGRGKGLVMCAVGFAYGVTGGAAGPFYTVSRSDDNPVNPLPGSLRYGVALGGRSRGVWITFSHSMTIVLKSMLWVRSSTTIDGRGANVTITGRMIVVGGVSNVILHNFQINSMQLSDTIHVFAGSSKVWVDHITSFNGKLGLVSVVQRATDVTISNCKLSNYNFNMLLGASDYDIDDRNLRVTVYRNWFKDSMQRMPHCRWGYCHVINNLYTNWGYYAIGGRVHAKIRSESNAFMPGRRTEVTPWYAGASYRANFDKSPMIISINDMLINGATFHQFGSNTASAYSSMMLPPYRTPAAYPPLLPNIRALPTFVKSCSGAIVHPFILRQCLHSTGFL